MMYAKEEHLTAVAYR